MNDRTKPQSCDIHQCLGIARSVVRSIAQRSGRLCNARQRFKSDPTLPQSLNTFSLTATYKICGGVDCHDIRPSLRHNGLQKLQRRSGGSRGGGQSGHGRIGHCQIVS